MIKNDISSMNQRTQCQPDDVSEGCTQANCNQQNIAIRLN